jgi:hypothetical protein
MARIYGLRLVSDRALWLNMPAILLTSARQPITHHIAGKSYV